MATSSFDKEFVVTDSKKSEEIISDLKNATPVTVRDENRSADEREALRAIEFWVSKG